MNAILAHFDPVLKALVLEGVPTRDLSRAIQHHLGIQGARRIVVFEKQAAGILTAAEHEYRLIDGRTTVAMASLVFNGKVDMGHYDNLDREGKVRVLKSALSFFDHLADMLKGVEKIQSILELD